MSSANQRSTRFSHDELVGVKWNVNRGWRSSHFLTLGVITGEVSSGKTVAVRAATSSLDASRHTVNYLGNPAVGTRGIYHGIVTALGGVPRFHKAALIPQAEAHLLSADQLEELRLLTNADMDSHAPFACLLIGQPTLRRRIKLGTFAVLTQPVGQHLVPLRPHDLRHTAVALWIAAGANVLEVARRAGHSSTSFTLDRYDHLFPEADAALADRLEALYEAPRPPADRSVTTTTPMTELFELDVDTPAGVVDVAAEIEILDDGTLVVDNLLVYPRGTARLDLGLREVWAIRTRLLDEARRMGATRVRISFLRTTGANPGRTMTVEVDLR